MLGIYRSIGPILLSYYSHTTLKKHFYTTNQGFGSAFFLADPDPVPDSDPDPDPGGIRGRGLGVKGKNDFFFFSFFHVSDDS